jgi:hypothetical protein
MIQKHQYLSIFVTVFVCLIGLLITIKYTGNWESVRGQILGVVSGIGTPQIILPTPGVPLPPTIAPKVVTVLTTIDPTSVVTTVIPTPVKYSVTYLNAPDNLTEGGVATFTWNVNGPGKIINKTGIYFGSTSHPGNLDLLVSPAETGYTGAVNDFLNGEYVIPLRFVGNLKIPPAGTYYSRAYALIDAENYWSDERVFTVQAVPKNDVSIITPPIKVKHGENTSFTWDVSGPANVTNYTVIVAGKTSLSGPLGTDIDIPHTPYTVLAKDFSGGNYNVPLRFIGNGIFPDTGIYYFRALVLINNKNIWSSEYQVTVE